MDAIYTSVDLVVIPIPAEYDSDAYNTAMIAVLTRINEAVIALDGVGVNIDARAEQADKILTNLSKRAKYKGKNLRTELGMQLASEFIDALAEICITGIIVDNPSTATVVSAEQKTIISNNLRKLYDAIHERKRLSLATMVGKFVKK